MTENHDLSRALRILEKLWSAMEAGPTIWPELPQPICRLPDLSEDAAITRSALGRELIAELDTLDTVGFPHDLVTTVKVAREVAWRWSKAGDWYWLVFDPSQIGFFGMFASSPYAGGFALSSTGSLFAAQTFTSSADVNRYLGLISDFARMVRQLDERTRGQAARGIVMPAPQIAPAIQVMTGLRLRAPQMLAPTEDRLAAVNPSEARRQIEAKIADEVTPAFENLIAYLSATAYSERAPKNVGLSQYPGGAEVYAELVRMHLSQDMTVAAVHEAGHSRMLSIRTQMRDIMDEVGFTGDPIAYRAAIEADPRWRAEGADAIAEIFRRYIRRMAPHMDQNFNFRQQAGYDVAALPTALESAMTFGYYDPPKQPDNVGRYLFNAKNLSEAPLMTVASLTYHELVPGHHLHFASQAENIDLHPVRKTAFFNAFNEGWAEYAATLAGELGMYGEPEERFGRLMNDSFLTCRLVVDTGMNAMGWSLEQAREYMRENSFMPETEIASESLRYSCDMPGQALAYKLADTYLLGLRETMKAALGERFALKDFHDSVLKPGALPLPLVKANVEAETARILAEVN